MAWKPGGTRSGNLVPGKWNLVPEVSTQGFHQHRQSLKYERPDKTGVFSIDAVRVMRSLWGGNWKLGPQIGTLTLAGCCAEPPLYASLRGRTREFIWLVTSEELNSGHISELSITELLLVPLTHVNRQFQVI